MTANNEIWSIDSEWGFENGRVDQESAWVPVVFCAVGLRSGRRGAFWGRDAGLRDFVEKHHADLFVGHYIVAEMKYMLRLDIPLPPNWFDTFVGYRYLSNGPDRAEAGLLAALRRLNLEHLAPATKQALQQKILALQFDADSSTERREIVDYCLSDCVGCGALYENISARVPACTMSHWSEYLRGGTINWRSSRSAILP